MTPSARKTAEKEPRATRVAREFAPVFGDARLNRRCVKVAAARFAQPGVSDCGASRDDAERQGALHFMNHRRTTAEAILAAHRPATLARCAEEREILVLGDTTECPFVTRAPLEGFGALCQKDAQGVFLQASYAVTPEGDPLGVLGADFFARDAATLGRGNSKARNHAPPEKKESRKWGWTLDAALALRRDLGPGPRITVIFDREGSNSAELVRAAGERDRYELIVRARHDRWEDGRTSEPKIHARLLAEAPAATCVVDVPAAPGRRARQATLAIHHRKTTLAPVRRRGPAGTPPAPPVEVWTVVAVERDPPRDLAPQEILDWRLWTTREIATAADARRVVADYARRWCIETLFRTFKSTQRALERQYRSAQKLLASMAMDLVLAFLHLHVVALARRRPTTPATRVFSRDECDAVWALLERPSPRDGPTLKEMADEVALLGGYRGRRGDRPYGVACFARGLQSLAAMVALWRKVRGSRDARADEPSALVGDA